MDSTFIHKSNSCSAGKIVVATETVYFSPVYTVLSDKIQPGLGEIGVLRGKGKIIPVQRNTVLPSQWLCTTCEKLLEIKDADEIKGTCGICGHLYSVKKLFTSSYGGICSSCLKSVKKKENKRKKKSSKGYLIIEESTEEADSLRTRDLNISTGADTSSPVFSSSPPVSINTRRENSSSQSDRNAPPQPRSSERGVINIGYGPGENFLEAAKSRVSKSIASNSKGSIPIAQAMFESNIKFRKN